MKIYNNGVKVKLLDNCLECPNIKVKRYTRLDGHGEVARLVCTAIIIKDESMSPNMDYPAVPFECFVDSFLSECPLKDFRDE